MGGNNARDYSLLPTDTSFVGGKMRLGHKRYDLANLAHFQRPALDLLHISSRDFVKRGAGCQYCSYLDNHYSCAKKQQNLPVSFIGCSEICEAVKTILKPRKFSKAETDFIFSLSEMLTRLN